MTEQEQTPPTGATTPEATEKKTEKEQEKSIVMKSSMDDRQLLKSSMDDRQLVKNTMDDRQLVKSTMDDRQLVEGRADVEKKKQMEPIEKAEEVKLKELPYYHGFLARDDIALILRKDGDFLLRLSEVDGATSSMVGRHLILSVYTAYDSPDGSKLLKLRNVIVSRIDGQYRLDSGQGFSTVKELIAHFQQNDHVSKQGNMRLKKGVPLQKWEFSHDDVVLSKLLGEGAFGEVREGVLTRKTKTKEKTAKVAVKLGKGQGEATKEKIKELMKEARIQNSLRHKNVVRLYGIMVLEQPIGIILELVDGGSLDSYLRTGEGLVEIKEKISMCSGAASGLSYIHAHRIIHRDIAARNCLYNGTSKLVKISDFGLSKKFSEKGDYEYKIRTGFKFPIKWLSPETIQSLLFSLKTDVYSYGVLVWEIFANGKEPWDGVGNAETKRKVTSGEFLTLSDDCPAKLKEFVQTKIYQLDKQKRCTMGDVVRFMEGLLTESKMVDYEADTSAIQTTKTDRAQMSSRERPTDDFYNKSTTSPKPKGSKRAQHKSTTSTYSTEQSKSVEQKKEKSTKEHGLRKKRTFGSKKFNKY